MSDTVLLIDTTLFLHGNAHVTNRNDVEVWIPQEVIDEVKSKISRLRMEQVLNADQVQIRSALPEAMKKAEDDARTTGDLGNLSRADIGLIALANEAIRIGFDPIVYTDDYSIQNVLKYQKIKFKSTTNDGIQKLIKWIYVCQACGAKFQKPQQNDECKECGTAGLISKKRA
ncbi:MAG: NOB1 family endonuclease [Candidatus Hodarchaeota archaeon]